MNLFVVGLDVPVLHFSFLQQVKSFCDDGVNDLVADGQLHLKALRGAGQVSFGHAPSCLFSRGSRSVPCACRAAV